MLTPGISIPPSTTIALEPKHHELKRAPDEIEGGGRGGGRDGWRLKARTRKTKKKHVNVRFMLGVKRCEYFLCFRPLLSWSALFGFSL